MRVTELMLGTLLDTDLQNAQAQLLKAQQQLATGNRINQPSDDPMGTERVLAVQEELAANAQYQSNASDALAWLQSSSSALQGAIDLAAQVRTLAVQGANSTLDASDRAALASQVGQLLAELVDAGNTRVGDHYLFNGQQTATAPFTLSAGSVTTNYGPSPAQPLLREIGPGVTVTLNPGTDTPASNVFQWTSGGASGGLLPAVARVLADLQPGGSTANLGGSDLAALDAALQAAQGALGELGAQMQRVQHAQSYLSDQQVSLQGLKGQLQGADIAQVVLQLQEEQNAYHGALAVGARMILPSLADYLP